MAMRGLPIACMLALIGCSTASDAPEPPPERPRQAPRRMARDFGPMLLDIVPDDSWWREPRLAEPLKLTDDQYAALEKIYNEQHAEIERLAGDVPVAQRDFRRTLNAEPAVQADITSAAQRVREIRNAIFDKQTQMLAAERLVLTKTQWEKLLDELQQREERGLWREGSPRGPRVYPRGGRGRPWPY